MFARTEALRLITPRNSPYAKLPYAPNMGSSLASSAKHRDRTLGQQAGRANKLSPGRQPQIGRTGQEALGS
jgi:hypothetical protein